MTDEELIEELVALADRGISQAWVTTLLHKVARRFQELTPKPPPDGAILVRIAVATNAYGHWYAFGDGGLDESDNIAEARNNVHENGVAVVIVETHIPRRDIPVIAGKVEDES
jgi:hypothetical protein